MGIVELLILGPLAARVDGRPITLGPPTQRLLLAALLLAAPSPLRREQLIEEVWGAAPPASARHAVEVYVSRLRSALGAGMITGGASGSYAVAAPADAQRFEALAGSAPDEARLSEALAMWRGAVLEDLTYEGSLRTEISRLEELRLAVRERLAEQRLLRDDHEGALPDLQRLVSSEPLRERARGFLMLALYRQGRQAEALDVFRLGRRHLIDELGIEPSPQLRELHAAILRHDPGLRHQTRPRRRNLPAPPTPLIGREHEIEEIAALLRGPARLVTLTGPGGTGKTRLALGAGEALLQDFADGAHFVDLSALSEPAAVSPEIARSLDLDPEGELVTELRDRNALLILDNFEQVLDAASTVVVVLAGAAACGCSPPAGSASASTASMKSQWTRWSRTSASSCSALARVRATAASLPARRSMTWWRESSPCRSQSSSPRAHRCDERRGDGRRPAVLELATGGPRDAPDRHRTLRATIDWSLALLDESDRKRFVALGAFAGGLDKAAAPRARCRPGRPRPAGRSQPAAPLG